MCRRGDRKAFNILFCGFWEQLQNKGPFFEVCYLKRLGSVARQSYWVFKVAEHSFGAPFCWCKLARAQGFQKTNMPSTERSFYVLNTRTICVIFLYNCMQCILLQRYVRKGNDAKTPAFLAFVCYRKNPVKCNACAVARKIETDCWFSVSCHSKWIKIKNQNGSIN